MQTIIELIYREVKDVSFHGFSPCIHKGLILWKNDTGAMVSTYLELNTNSDMVRIEAFLDKSDKNKKRSMSLVTWWDFESLLGMYLSKVLKVIKYYERGGKS